jgi:hypothetical protein
MRMDLLGQRVRVASSPHDESLIGLTGTVKFGTGGFRVRLDKPLPPTLQSHPEVALGSVLIGDASAYDLRDQALIATLVQPVNRQWPKHHAAGQQPQRTTVAEQPVAAPAPVAFQPFQPSPARAPAATEVERSRRRCKRGSWRRIRDERRSRQVIAAAE